MSDELVPQPSTTPRTHLLWWFAGAVTLFHVATAAGYGHFRDELYYLACADHLAFGYVDHPPLVALIAAFVRTTLGDSLWALRLLPALAAGATVWFTGALCVELGGRAFAQAVALTCAALAPVILSLCTFFSMNSFDLLIWAVAFWLFVHVLKRDRMRDWLTLGVVLGVGLENKLSVLCLGMGIALGLLAQRPAVFRTRGPWLAGSIAFLLFVPHLVWQVQYGFPTLEFMHNARAHKMLALAPGEWLVEQILQVNPFSLPIWLAGLVYLLWSPRAREQRGLGIAFLTVLGIVLLGQGKSYYTAPAYLPMFAAGGVALEGLSVFRRPALRAAVLTILLLTGLLTVPMAKPVLPVADFIRYQQALGLKPGSSGERHEVGVLPQFFADMHGWSDLTDTVARVYQGLSQEERKVACIFGENYGQAGAIDVFGRAHGLPPGLSGHNNYFLWGARGCTGDVVIVIGGTRERIQRAFESVEQASTFECALCRPDENHKPIWIARGVRVPFTTLWADIKHYD